MTGPRDFISAAGFLFTVLVAGGTKYHQTPGGVFSVERFKAAVLWREARKAGGINDQNNLTSVVGHRDKLATQTGG